MSDYTPTTEEVLDAYVAILMVAAREEGVSPKKEAYRQAVERWLVEHDREVRAAERERIHVEVKRFVDDLAKHGGDDPYWSDLYQIVRGIETGGE